MTEEEARATIAAMPGVSRETLARLDAFARAVVAENANQNLISAGTVPHIWHRHLLDSAQLVALADGADPMLPWLDLGSGPGFPGLVVAIITGRDTILVEARRRRAEFLADQVRALGLSKVEVVKRQLESVPTRPVSVISARAFAPLPKLLQLAHRFAHEKTRWLLPKGRGAREELETIRGSWQGVFHVKPSRTDPDAAILVASGVVPGKGRA